MVATKKKEQQQRLVLFLLGMITVLLVTSCNKTSIRPEPEPVAAPATTNATAIDLRVSQSQVTLLQDNANLSILNLSWEPTGAAAAPGTLYSIEYSLVEFDFKESVIIDSTYDKSLNVTAEHLNQHMSELIEAGNADMIKLRVRAESPATKAPVYSNAIALKVTTYHRFYDYSYPQVIHLPGNYENWKVATAPHIVSTANNGTYEGYVNFANPTPQFLMVKAEDWDPLKTYYYIGANKVGFGGSLFTLKDGPGVYRIKLNSETNTWEYTKISNWEIFGSALPDSASVPHVMKFNQSTLSWTITLPLKKGKFRIRANDGNAISFGHIHNKGYVQPDSKGDDFEIDTDGFYTVTLNLQAAGNYACSVIRRDPSHDPS